MKVELGPIAWGGWRLSLAQYLGMEVELGPTTLDEGGVLWGVRRFSLDPSLGMDGCWVSPTTWHEG